MSHLEPSAVLTLVSHPTRILGMIPQLFGCTIFGSFSTGFIMACVSSGGFFLALSLFGLGIGISLWITLKDEDFIRILWAQRYFRRIGRSRLISSESLYRA